MSTYPKRWSLEKNDAGLILVGILLIIISIYHTWSTVFITNQILFQSGRLLKCSGDCKYKGPDNFLWTDAFKNKSLDDNSFIYTQQETIAKIDLLSGNKLTLLPSTIVRIITNGPNKNQIEVIKGKIKYTKVNGQSDVIIADEGTIETSQSTEEFSSGQLNFDIQNEKLIALRQEDVSLKLKIVGGAPPYSISTKGKVLQVDAQKPEYILRYTTPGIDYITITDRNGTKSESFVEIMDLQKPQILFPKNFQSLKVKNFYLGTNLKAASPVVAELVNDKFKDVLPLSSVEENLAMGMNRIRIHNRYEDMTSEWSEWVEFRIVEANYIEVITPNNQWHLKSIYLSWANPNQETLYLTIWDHLKKIVVKKSIQDHFYKFEGKGKFSWTIDSKPNLASSSKSMNFELLSEYYLNLMPQDKTEMAWKSSNSFIELNWQREKISEPFPEFLIIESRGKLLEKISVKNKNSYVLKIAPGVQYSWRLQFIKNKISYDTTPHMFQMGLPPKLNPIKANEIQVNQKK